jgi:type II restriction enzyme
VDTNARKNRTGTLMENIVGKYIKQFTQKYGGQYIEQATKKRISYEWGIELELDKINRRIDFAVLNRSRKLYLFETNYYSGGGSKLKATAGEYKDLEDLLKGQGQTFIWVTDGKGWLTAKTAINETFLHNDYIINLEMITDGILHEIIDK